MSASVLYMSMSLDGSIATDDDRLGGDDGARLHHWLLNSDRESFRTHGVAAAFAEEFETLGAIVVGRQTAEVVDHWGGEHHVRGIPIFVPSHRLQAPPLPTIRW